MDHEYVVAFLAANPRGLPMKLTRNLGMLLLAVWLVLTGLVPLLNFS